MTPPFEHALAPQFYDFDMGGVAHNVVYVRWLEDARLAFLRESGWPIERMQDAGVLPAVTRTEIDYKCPVRPGNRLAARVSVERVGRSAWTLRLALLHPETENVYAAARQEGCFIRFPSLRPAAMPPEFAVWLRGHLETSG